ncbi:hypothetical protein SAY86_019927 [Trapa natans]|uniref:NAC domain-containing protein n=1 Tax=Trapa natans TaxID=22666 RepID=A0AAN7LI58_TRANT|nr:hypothetical protein SAY86_019927 [Trapa natans]
MALDEKMISMKKLPVGWRLNPSDEDLVNHHLKRKLQDIQEDYCLIPEFDIYKLPPWDLITKFKDLSDLSSDGRECYFFYRRDKPNGKRQNRRTKEGYWKVTGEGRKPRDTDQMKWLKRILVFHIGKQKSSDKSAWVMHEWENISDTVRVPSFFIHQRKKKRCCLSPIVFCERCSVLFQVVTVAEADLQLFLHCWNQKIVVCRISKAKSKKGRAKVDAVSFEACPIQSPGSTSGSEIQIRPEETSTDVSGITLVEPPNMTPTSNVDFPDISMYSPQQTNLVAEEILSFPKDAYTDTVKIVDHKYPQDSPILEQSSCSANASITHSDQRDGSCSHSGDVAFEEDGDMSIFWQMFSHESLGLAEFVSPPQHRGDDLGQGDNMSTKESPPETWDSDIDSILNSFFSSSPYD